MDNYSTALPTGTGLIIADLVIVVCMMPCALGPYPQSTAKKNLDATQGCDAWNWLPNAPAPQPFGCLHFPRCPLINTTHGPAARPKAYFILTSRLPRPEPGIVLAFCSTKAGMAVSDMASSTRRIFSLTMPHHCSCAHCLEECLATI